MTYLDYATERVKTPRFVAIRTWLYQALTDILPTLGPWKRGLGGIVYQDERARRDVDPQKALHRMRARHPMGIPWKVGDKLTMSKLAPDGETLTKTEATIVSIDESGDGLELES